MRLTASALSRAESCIGSAVLAAISESGAYADTGNVIDLFVQQGKRDFAAALQIVPDYLRSYCAALPLEKIPDGSEFQVAFGYNVLTGEVRRIPSRSEGYPDMPPEWIFGSSDIVGMRPGRAYLVDLKWGSSTVGRDPAEDLQLGFLSMCAAKVGRVSECETGFLRAGWDARLTYDMALLDEWALDAIEERVRKAWRRQQAATADTAPLHVGEHCTYCPSRRACPAMVQPVAMVLRAEIDQLAAETLPTLDTLKPRIDALSVPEQGRLYERIDVAIDHLTMIKGILRDNARREALPLSGGRELREVMWGTSQKSDVAKAQIAELCAGLEALGEIATVKVPQVRAMKAKKEGK